MMLAPPQLVDMFAGVADAAERFRLFEDFKAAMNTSLEKTVAGKATFQGPLEQFSQSGASDPIAQLEAQRDDMLVKGVDADTLAGLTASIESLRVAAPDIAKDITLTSPLSTGFVPYDLEAPSKKIFPVLTPFRNRIARVPGKGTSRKFKRIDGISGSGTGGASIFNPGLADNTTDTFGALTLQRPHKMSYVASEATKSYVQMGVSDSVTWSAEFSGLGFEDIRQFSQTAVLYASMLADENALAFGRGTTANGYGDKVIKPAAATVTARVANAAETGNSATIANLYVYLTAITPFGETEASTVLNSTALAAVTGRVLDVAITDSYGALGYNVYAGLTTGEANAYYYGTTRYGGSATGYLTAPYSIQFTGGGTGGAIATGTTAPTTNTTYGSNNFDGIFTVCSASTSGYQARLNTVLSTTSPGAEYQTAFAAMYDANKADPDEVDMNGFDRKQLSEAVHGGSSTPPGYRIQIDSAGGDSVKLGTMVTTIVNEVTGKGVDINVYPWAPQGSSVILSHSLPFPNTEVSSCWAYALVQDYMAVNWPVIQTTYDFSSYWYGALIPYAPAYQGFVGGIKRA